MITFAKGVTSGYTPLGGVVVRERIAEPFRSSGTSFSHGITFAGHPLSCAVALANLDLMQREDLNGRVRSLESEFRGRLETLLNHPMVEEVRGMEYFYALQLGRDGESLSDEEQDWLLESFLSRRLPELGLICRTDDLGPAIGLSPPLTAGPSEFATITGILSKALDEAWAHISSGKLQIDSPSTKRMPAATA